MLHFCGSLFGGPAARGDQILRVQAIYKEEIDKVGAPRPLSSALKVSLWPNMGPIRRYTLAMPYNGLNRREFLKTASATVALALGGVKRLDAASYVRRDIGGLSATDPVVMSYRKAVRAMMALPPIRAASHPLRRKSRKVRRARRPQESDWVGRSRAPRSRHGPIWCRRDLFPARYQQWLPCPGRRAENHG